MLCYIILQILAATFLSAGQIDCTAALSEADIDVDELNQWMQVFRDDPFFKLSEDDVVAPEKRHARDEDEDFRYKCSKKEDAVLTKRSDIFSSRIRLFPANVIMIQAMYKLMKPNGVLAKEGFTYDGKIKTNGAAMILFSRPFASEDVLIDRLNKSRGKRLTDLEVAIGEFDKQKPLVAVTNYILSSKDVDGLIEWLKEKKKKTGGHERHSLVGKRLILIVSYACCTKTLIPALAPKYGTIKLMIG